MHRALIAVLSAAFTVSAFAISSPSTAGQVPASCGGLPATIVGTPGDDRLVGTDGDDVIAGLEGLDYIEGGAGDDVICGGPTVVKEDEDGYPLEQWLIGDAGNDTLIGGDGLDTLHGKEGDDVLRGGAGPDRIHGYDGADRILGEDGDDTLDGGPGPGIIAGGPGDDLVVGGDDADVLRGDAGRDQLDGDSGDDQLLGGEGRDIAAYLFVRDDGSAGSHRIDVTVNLTTGTADGDGFGRDRLRQIEDAWTGGGDDRLIGDAGANEFFTGGYNGRDRVEGRGGTDTLTFDSESIEGFCCDRLRVDLAAGQASWGASRLTIASIENVVGTGYNDVILGDDGPNVLKSALTTRWFHQDGARIDGRSGSDLVQGSGGDDRLRGGPGNDRLFGLGGPDTLDGGPGRNTNNGGGGPDRCVRPGSGKRAVGCEGKA